MRRTATSLRLIDRPGAGRVPRIPYAAETAVNQREERIMSEAHVVAVAESDFQSFIESSSNAVVVDFWAPWCGPCNAMAPRLEQFAIENEGKVKVGKVNVDQARRLAAEFGIRSIPTLVLFKNGKPKSQVVGLPPELQLSSWLESAL